MYILFILSSLYALAFASPDKVARQEPGQISSVISRISSLGADLLPPPSLVPQLTGILASEKSALFNTALQSSLANEFTGPNGPPAWFTSLSPDAKSYILAVPGKESTIISQIISIEVDAGFSTLILPPATTLAAVLATTTTESSTSTSEASTPSSPSGRSIISSFSSNTVGSNSIITIATISKSSTKASDSMASVPIATTSSKSKPTSSSTAGAPHATGNIVIGMISVLGFLGLAIAL